LRALGKEGGEKMRGGVDGGSDAATTVRTQGGRDDVVSATPGSLYSSIVRSSCIPP